MDEYLKELISELIAQASVTRASYNDLFDPNVDTIPIPFFGNLLNAKVITIGLNPSDGEIKGRGWSEPTSTNFIFERLLNYFNNSDFIPHPWFKTWEQSLNEIGLSYLDGSAAHVDLCPWATKPMSGLPDIERFERIVTESLPWFWRCIEATSKLQLILMAGAVSKNSYMNEFLLKKGSFNGNEVVGKIKRGGKAFVGWQQLHLANKSLPLFFCSVSPSSRTSSMLPLRVRENREQLTKLIGIA